MKPFQRDLGIVLLANLISKPLWLIVDNLAQNQIGHEAYGLIGALLGIGQWAIAIADWGLYAMVTREMARGIEHYPRLSGITFILKLILTIIAGIFFIGLGWILGYREKAFLWLIALILYQLALSYLQYFRAYLQGAQRFRVDAFFSAAEKVFVLLLLGASWNILSGDLYVGILVIAGGVTAVLSGLVIWREYGLPTFVSDRSDLWKAFRQMTPFALMGYATAFNERLNQILLERWVSPYANGLYWGAYRWFSAAMMYLWIVLPLFFARFAKLGRQRSPELWKTFVWGQLVSSLPIIGIAGVFLGAPKVFLWLFTHSSPSEITQMSHILQALAFALILNGLTAIYSTYLTAVGYEWVAFWLMVGASTINFIACLFLIPTGAGVGAGIGLGISYLFYGAGFIWTFKKVAPIPTPLSVLVRLVLLSILYGATLFMIGQFSEEVITLLSAGISLIFWSWVLGIFKQWKYASRHR
ncbi:MAG: oligosaccharide flippase family protein [Bacteroidia bacterium]|nr:oligosaccharide flippase family protein [Bacteroidia bacterium]MDW8415986.1 oligosaccharide flippase family protein [Bacteroidia bacterium]